VKYRIIVEESAAEEIDSTTTWIAEHSPAAARGWYVQVKAAIYSLAEHPKRCPLAPENDFFRLEIRHLLHGRRGHVYRILFTIDKKAVHVLHVIHGSRDWLRPNESDS